MRAVALARASYQTVGTRSVVRLNRTAARAVERATVGDTRASVGGNPLSLSFSAVFRRNFFKGYLDFF